MRKSTLILLGLFATQLAYADGGEFKKLVENIVFWISSIGIVLSGGIIVASKVWPDSFLDQLARRYAQSLGYAVLAFAAFLIFKGQIGEFFAWMRNPTSGL